MKLSLVISALFLAAGSAVAASQPPVYAAWSQLDGPTSVPITADTTAPTVEMRFATDVSAACSDFTIRADSFVGTTAPADITPQDWASTPLAVRVCRAALPED